MILSKSARLVTRAGTNLVNKVDLYEVEKHESEDGRVRKVLSSARLGDDRGQRVLEATEQGLPLVEVELVDMRGFYGYPKTVGGLSVAGLTLSHFDYHELGSGYEADGAADTIRLNETTYDPSFLNRFQRLATVVIPETCEAEYSMYTDMGTWINQGSSYAFEGSWGDLRYRDVVDHISDMQDAVNLLLNEEVIAQKTFYSQPNMQMTQ